MIRQFHGFPVKGSPHLFTAALACCIASCGYSDCYDASLSEKESLALNEFVALNHLDSLHPGKYGSQRDTDCKTSHIQNITASDVGLDTIPQSFSEFTHATTILLDHNDIRSLPDGITDVRPLNFSIGWNRLCQVPDSISRWLDAHDSLWWQTQVCPNP